MTRQQTTLDQEKAALRRIASDARAKAFDVLGKDAGHPLLLDALRNHSGKTVAGYLPMRTEISPLGALIHHRGPVCMPVMTGRAQPLRFRQWTPDATLVTSDFGTRAPESGVWCVPHVLIVPMLAFDRRGFRLGYGGGFYDRTLSELRRGPGCFAIGFGFAAQEVDHVPSGPLDAALDMIVTEQDCIVLGDGTRA